MTRTEQIEMLHKMGFKGLVINKSTKEIIAASSWCATMTKLAAQLGDEYEYKESY